MDGTRHETRSALSRALRVLMALTLLVGLMPGLSATAWADVAVNGSSAAHVDGDGAAGDEVRTALAENADAALAGEAPPEEANPLLGVLRTLGLAPTPAKDGLIESGEFLLVKYTVADKSMISADDTIESMFSKEETARALAAQYSSFAELYELGYDADYYVAFVGAPELTDAGNVQDCVFALNDDFGNVIGDAVYDYDNGIAYIPKSYYSGDELVPVQLQALVPLDIAASADERPEVAVKVDGGGAVEVPADVSVRSSALDMTVTIPIATPETAAKINLMDIEVTINGADTPVKLDDGNAVYDASTGELTLTANPLTLAAVDVSISKTFFGAKRAYALSSTGDWFLKDPSNNKVVLRNLDLDNLSEGDLFTMDNVRCGYAYDGADLDKQVIDWAKNYCYIWGSNPEGLYNLIARGTGKGSSSWWDAVNTSDIAKGSTAAYFDGTVTAPQGEHGGQNWDGFPVTGTVNGWSWKALGVTCGHVANPIGVGQEQEDGNYTGSVWWRVLKIDEDAAEPYIIIGICGPYFSTQSGCGVYKVGIETKGKANVKKVSAKTNVTAGNPLYSVEGAVFGIWATQADAQAARSSNRLKKLTVEASGTSNTVNLDAGDYWVAETKAPAGYQLNTTPQKLTVTAGETTTLPFSDEPQMDPAEVQKQDQQTGSTPQGSASFEGMRYTFKFYAGAYYTAANLPSTPTRTWVLKADSDGHCALENGATFKVSGDDFYYRTDGSISCPLGTLAITETKAPTGYRLGYYDSSGTFHAPETVVYQVKPNSNGGAEATLDLVSGSATASGAAKSTDAVLRGNLSGGKTDSMMPDGKAQGAATLGGATLEVVNKNQQAVVSPQTGRKVNKNGVVCTLKTAADGTYSTTRSDLNGWSIPAEFGGCALPYGEYEVHEAASPTGYLLNESWSQTFTVSSQGQAISKNLTDDVKRGNLAGGKTDSMMPDGTAQGAATLGGATLEVVNKNREGVLSPQTGQVVSYGGVVCTLKTAEDGTYSTTRSDLNGWSIPAKFNGGALAYGEYEVHESAPPEGYLLNSSWSETFTVSEHGQTVTESFTDDAKRGNLAGGKTDSMTRDGKAQGAATLGGATLEVVNKNRKGVVSPQTGQVVNYGGVVCTLKTAEDGTYSTTRSDLNGWSIPAKFNGGALAYGEYEVHEAASPTGYLLNESWSATFKVSDQGQTVTESFTDDVKRGDFEFYKVAGDKQRPLANIPFVITSKATGESHVAVTDSNGFFSSSSAFNAHSDNTNKNDKAVSVKVGDDGEEYYAADETKLDPSAGIWFSGHDNDKGSPVDDSLGAFPYDEYTLEEVRCDANEGYELIEAGTFTISRHNLKIGPVTYNDNKPVTPSIGTTLTDDWGTDSVPGDGQYLLNDKVGFSNFEEGTYVFKGELHAVDADGADQGVIATSNKQVAISFDHGEVEMGFVIDTSMYAGKGLRLVATEQCFTADGELYAEHSDLADEFQTVYIPEIGTTLTDLADGDHEAPSCGKVTLTDTVAYEGLTPQKQYTITLTLHKKDAEGNDAGELLDAAGKPVSATQRFFPSGRSGTVDVSVSFEPADGGYDVVAFEEVKHKDATYAVHADITDESQTVRLPAVATTATDESTGEHVAALGPAKTIVDSVAYSNLEVGADYVVSGTVHVRDSEGADAGELKDSSGEPVVSSAKFTPTSADGTVEVRFEFDSEIAPGTTLVVFEQLARDGSSTPVAEHSDIADEGQTVYVGKAVTTAVDKQTSSHYARSNANFTITDKVTYTNLAPGVEYVVHGTLHRPTDDGEEAVSDSDGNALEATSVFTAEEGNGRVLLDIEVNPENLSGKVVVFEEIGVKVGDETVWVAEHKDIDDGKQAVWIPTISTRAYDRESGKNEADADRSATIVDVSSYEGLEKGAAYRLVATLMDKKTGQEFLDDGQKVTGEASFTAKKPSGEQPVELKIDNAALGGKELVVFERLYDAGGNVVAVHEDFNAEEQTVRYHTPIIPKVEIPKLEPPKVEIPIPDVPELETTELIKKGGELFDKTGYWLAEYWWVILSAAVGLLLAGAIRYMGNDEDSVFNQEDDEASE